jgi:hypothetical protein
LLHVALPRRHFVLGLNIELLGLEVLRLLGRGTLSFIVFGLGLSSRDGANGCDSG